MKKRSASQAVEINGWSVFAHPLCLDQVENLIAAVEDEVAKGTSDTANMKLLRGIHRFAFVEIPKDPAGRRFRLGNTIGPEHRHWFRAKFGAGRFRLFFRFQSQAKIIVLGWVNDQDTLRAGIERPSEVVNVRLPGHLTAVLSLPAERWAPGVRSNSAACRSGPTSPQCRSPASASEANSTGHAGTVLWVCATRVIGGDSIDLHHDVRI